MGVWSIGFGNGYETNDVEEILEFCLKTYRELALPPTDEDGMPFDNSTFSDAALPLIIGIDGRSGSGKTRLSELLELSLSAEGIGVRVLTNQVFAHGGAANISGADSHDAVHGFKCMPAAPERQRYEGCLLKRRFYSEEVFAFRRAYRF